MVRNSGNAETPTVVEETRPDELTTDETLIVEDDAPVQETPVDENTSMIVYHQAYVDQDGVGQIKVHGPMPVADWEAYRVTNGF